MKINSTMTAVAAGLSALVAANSATADTIVSGGEARITITEDLSAFSLDTNWNLNDDGQPEYFNHVRSSPGFEYTYLRRGEIRTWIASERSGSTYISPDAAKLKLASSTMYLFPTDADGEVIESFAPAVWIAPQRSSNEGYDLFTEELRNINFVPTGDSLVWEDFENPGTTYTLTEDQVAVLTEEVDDLRLCCAHTLGNLEIDTAAMTIDGIIDSIAERDINFDGVVDESDEFYLFDMVNTDDENVYGLALTETLAEFLNYGFTPPAFADGDVFAANWGYRDGDGNLLQLDFMGGDVIGEITYSYSTEVVPLPAGMSLMLGGLGVLGAARARRGRKG